MLQDVEILKPCRYKVLPIPYPNILGYSAAGLVESVGANVTRLKMGDHVAVNRLDTVGADSRFGTFQTLFLAQNKSCVLLDPETSFADAAATIVNLATAVSALSLFEHLDRPDTNGRPKPRNGKKVLVYGGSSGVAGFAIKYAYDAGYQV